MQLLVEWVTRDPEPPPQFFNVLLCNLSSFCPILANLSLRLIGELIAYPWSGVRPLSSTILNMNICATSGPITVIKKHHWDGEKAALGFGPDRIKTLVSMATDSSHRVIMKKTFFLGVFVRSF